ncbi:MAG TPA: hypothetical protein VFN35_29305, partial [Ktedonobacteraceae bacterium]|nr:hypothetical protein [Ktedonobacteraceae bacterium]
VLGVSYTFLGIYLAAENGTWPVSFFIATISFAVYLPVRLFFPLSRQRRELDARQIPPDVTTSSKDQLPASQTAVSEHLSQLSR